MAAVKVAIQDTHSPPDAGSLEVLSRVNAAARLTHTALEVLNQVRPCCPHRAGAVEVLSSILEAAPDATCHFHLHVTMSDLETLLVRHEGVRHFAYEATGEPARRGRIIRGKIAMAFLPARAPPRPQRTCSTDSK